MRPSSGIQNKKTKLNLLLHIVRELCWDQAKSLQLSKLLILYIRFQRNIEFMYWQMFKSMSGLLPFWKYGYFGGNTVVWFASEVYLLDWIHS